MFFDPVRRAYIDESTGEVVFQEEYATPQSYPNTSNDYEFALSLSSEHKVNSSGNFIPIIAANRKSVGSDGIFFSDNQYRGSLHNNIQQPADFALTEIYRDTPNGVTDDWSYARALQMMEFEIYEDVFVDPNYNEQQEQDFNSKEIQASNCTRQMLTISTFIVVVQIAVLIVCISYGGWASQKENPMLGPPAITLVKFGAKSASLIVYKDEWWRIFAPIMLHAGVWHLLSNAFIQLRVGGYLNLIFGTPVWCLIYLCSGVYGNMLSCIFNKNKIGVGSSGAVLGILTAWAVWIVFRWNKIPERYHRQRNCQFGIVASSVIVTLAASFAPYIDWSAHFGGAIQGLLWGIILLSRELENQFRKNMVRVVAIIISFGLIIYSAYYIAVVLKPNRDFVEYFEENDW